MKSYTFHPFALSLIVIVFTYSDVRANSDPQTEAALQRLNDLQTCFENIDSKSIEQLKQNALSAATEIEALCAAGKRNAAADFAKKFREKNANSDWVRQTEKCSQVYQDKATNTPNPFSEQNKKHVCDH